MDNYFIMIDNDLFDSKNILPIEFTLLILVKRNLMYNKNLALCSLSLIYNYMHLSTKTNQRLYIPLKEALSKLIEKKLCQGIYDLAYNQISIESIVDKDYLFYVEFPPIPEEYSNFFMVMDNDIDKIFKHLTNTNIDKFSLVRYYIAICRVINNEHHFGYMAQSVMSDVISDSRTVGRYNKILQDELHLIRYCNNYVSKDKHYCTTYFSDYKDDNLFYALVVGDAESKGLVYTDKVKSNKKRSLKQKINNLCSVVDIEAKIKAEYEAKLTALKAEYEAAQYKPKSVTAIQKQTTKIKSANPEYDLLLEFLGESVNNYQQELERVKDGICSIQTFFRSYCEYETFDKFNIFKLKKSNSNSVPESIKLTRIEAEEILPF